MEPVELLLNMAAAMTERTTLIYVRVAAAAGGGVSEVKWGEGCAAFFCLPACFSVCLPAAFASIVLYLLFAPWLC